MSDNMTFAFNGQLQKLRQVVSDYGKKRIASNLKLVRFAAAVNKLDDQQRQALYMAMCGHRKPNQWHLDQLNNTLAALQK
jgi:hypothetical protein